MKFLTKVVEIISLIPGFLLQNITHMVNQRGCKGRDSRWRFSNIPPVQFSLGNMNLASLLISKNPVNVRSKLTKPVI